LKVRTIIPTDIAPTTTAEDVNSGIIANVDWATRIAWLCPTSFHRNYYPSGRRLPSSCIWKKKPY